MELDRYLKNYFRNETFLKEILPYSALWERDLEGKFIAYCKVKSKLAWRTEKNTKVLRMVSLTDSNQLADKLLKDLLSL